MPIGGPLTQQQPPAASHLKYQPWLSGRAHTCNGAFPLIPFPSCKQDDETGDDGTTLPRGERVSIQSLRHKQKKTMIVWHHVKEQNWARSDLVSLSDPGMVSLSGPE